MSITSFLITTILFILVLGLGYLFSRRVLNVNKLIYLIPLSACLGISFFVIPLHFLARLLNLERGIYSTLSIFFIAIVFILIKFKPGKSIEYRISHKGFFLLIIFSSLISLLCLWHLVTFGSYDKLGHFIGTLAKQNNYPPLCHFCPEAKFNYHYGVILFGSMLVKITGIESWNSLIPIQLLFIFITPFAFFIFIFSITKSFTQSFFASIIGCLCANLALPYLVTDLKFDSLESFFKSLHRILTLMNESGFASSTSKRFVSPNISVAIPTSIILFYLCTSEKIKEKSYLLATIFVSSFLFYTYEAFWLPVLISAFFYHVYVIVKNRMNMAQILYSLLLFSLLIITSFLMGGIIGEKEENVSKVFSFNPKPYLYSWIGLLEEVYPYEWLQNHRVISPTGGIEQYKVPFFSIYFLIEMGLPFIFLPAIIIWLFKKKNPILIFFLISGFVSLIIPFLVDYLPIQVATERFFTYSRIVFSILFGSILGNLFEYNFPKPYSLPLRSLLTIIVLITTIPAVIWIIPIKIEGIDYRYNQFLEIDKKALNWLKKYSSQGDRGLGPSNNATLFELVNLSGVYGVGNSKDPIFEEETRNTALTTLDPCLLKELKVRWIYLDNKLLDKVPQEQIIKLKKERLLTLKYKSKDENEIRKIYKFKSDKIDLASCSNKNYAWGLGRIQNGTFTPLTDATTMKLIIFNDKKIAITTLNELKKRLDPKEAYLYRIEAIKI